MNMSIKLIIVCLFSAVHSVYAMMDDAKLKEYLSQNFIADESMPWEKRAEFKESRSITDEQLHRVLMEIYSQSSQERNSLVPKTRQWYDNRRTIEGVLGWLPVCGNIPVKSFLMDFAVTKENDYLNRRYAVLSYLRLADPEESKNILLRFLVEADRVDSMSRLSIYGFAKMAYDTASPEKKASILAALLAAASREEGKIEFMKVDKILAEKSAAYRLSRERLAMLERHSLEPPTTNLYTDRDLKASLEECRKYKTHTSISTNLAALKTRNFNLPQPAGTTNELTDPVPAPSEVELVKIGDESDDPIPMKVIAIVIILAIIGLSVWKTKRK